MSATYKGKALLSALPLGTEHGYLGFDLASFLLVGERTPPLRHSWQPGMLPRQRNESFRATFSTFHRLQ